MKKLIIFDLDGTLTDSIYSVRDAVNMTMRKHGFPERDYEQVRKAMGNGARELIRLSMPEDKSTDAELVSKVLADYDELYALTYANVKGCYPGVEQVVRQLKESGYFLAVISNKQDMYVKKIVEMLFPDGTIDYALGQTELPRKPDPTVPLMIAEKFGVTHEECIFVGDSDVDVMTGKNAKMTMIACTWGYRPREVLTDADYLVDNAQQLRSAIGLL